MAVGPRRRIRIFVLGVSLSVGVVDIDTRLGFEGAAAAGTGMILTSDGEILTNNHVVRGATTLSVTVISTGKTYEATVVGTAPAEDVAVIKLKGASGLTPAIAQDQRASSFPYVVPA